MIRTTFFLLLGSLGLPTFAHAEGPLDLQAAWAEASANNASLAQARAELASARAQLAIARPLLPNPEVGLEYENDLVFGNEGQHTFRVSIEQALPVFGTRAAAVEEAQARIAAANAGIAGAESQLLAELRTALANVAAARATRELRSELEQTASELAMAAATRAQTGELPQSDANLAAVEAAAAAADLADAWSAEASANARLCPLLGRSSCAPIEAAWPVAPGEVPEEEELVQEALGRHPDVARAASERASADASLRQMERARIPVPTLGLGYSEDQSVFDQPITLRNEDRFLGVSLRIPIPLWSTGAGEAARARAERSSASAQLQGVMHRVPADVRAARSRVLAARAAAMRWDEVEPRIAETLRWIRRGFETGHTSVEAYLVARDRLVRAQQGIISSRLELAAASAELDRAAGRPPATALSPSSGAPR